MIGLTFAEMFVQIMSSHEEVVEIDEVKFGKRKYNQGEGAEKENETGKLNYMNALQFPLR